MRLSKSILSSMSLVAVMALSGCGGGGSSSDSAPATTGDSSITAAQSTAVLTRYADIALASYSDSLSTAQTLKTALETFTTTPNASNLQAAKDAWIASREPYLQTEAFRLSGGPIDAEGDWVETAYGALEGQLNAWPLDEAMIDDITNKTGASNTENIINNGTAGTMTSFTNQEGTTSNLDAPTTVSTIDVGLLSSLNENGGDANVASGYHAIEFLLWGQDQDYNSFAVDAITTGDLVAGERPLTDYTDGSPEATRRAEYLLAAADKIIADLTTVKSAWETSVTGNCSAVYPADASGCYRGALLGTLTGADTDKNIDSTTALKAIMAGLGVFLKSELANERIAVALLTPSEEDEHSCFSDNTHRDIYGDAKGFENLLKGEYAIGGISASATTSLYDLASTDTKAALDAAFVSINAKITTINDFAATTAHFDYQIQSTKYPTQAGLIGELKNELRSTADKMVDVASDLGISLTQDDVTDPDETNI